MKYVAVIGAGPTGLVSLRSLSQHTNELQFIAYEQSDRVGGTWIYHDPYKHTSMYENLRTNLPKELMAFPGFPFSSETYSSFIGHKEVLEYLESFAQHYQLHQYIKFRHRVIKVDPFPSESTNVGTLWNVTVEDIENATKDTIQVDAVITCNGHYSDPLIPELEGQDTFTGRITHTTNYRSPEECMDKVVLVLGAGPSGIDVALDIASSAQKIYLSQNNAKQTCPMPANLEQVSGIQKIDGDDIVLKSGMIVHADLILLATGYRYAFPFLSSECHPEIRDEHIKPLYKMIVDINHPSLYFIGLNKIFLPFPQFHMQAEFAVGCITGTVKQESKEVMEQDYLKRYKILVTDRGQRDKYFHKIADHQWEYNDELAADCGIPPLDRRLEKLFSRVGGLRSKNVLHYKEAVYRLNEDSDGFDILYEPSDEI